MIKRLFSTLLLWPNRAARKLNSTVAKYKLKSNGVHFGKKFVVAGMPIISRIDGSLIQIGEHVVLCSRSDDTALGVTHPVILRTLTPTAKIIIEDHVGISGGAICAAKAISIGKNTMLGANVTIADTDFHPLAANNRRYNHDFANVASREVVIEENVFVGTNAIILKGVRIGKNSVIGAGSVVVSDIPANVIAAGNPCKVIKPL